MLGEYKASPVEHRKYMACGSVEVEEKDQWVLNLAIGVVKQAAEDYRAALRTHNEGAIKALTSWFRSEWGQLLSFGQGGAIIRGLKKEAEEYDTDET